MTRAPRQASHALRCASGVLLGVALVFLSVKLVRAQGAQIPPSRVLVEGEELVYNVRYAFIDLGQVRIKTLAKSRNGNTVDFSAKALIDSYPRVPFVDLHAVFESTFDSTVFSRYFSGRTKENGSWAFSRYVFEYDRRRVLMEVGESDSVVARRDTLQVDGPALDGLSLFFLARDRLYTNQSLNIPTIIKEENVNTYIDFRNERTSVEIDALDYPVDVIRFEGNAGFVGLFGLTGDFKGWFSNDEARIPIKAKMRVILGSVTIELMEWKRPGWSPPKGEE